MKTKERKVNWNQEKYPKQEGKDDCRQQCNPTSKRKRKRANRL
jgi:hypothetical protein